MPACGRRSPTSPPSPSGVRATSRQVAREEQRGGVTGARPSKPRGIHMPLVVSDGDVWWQRVLEAGCTVVMPFERQFWGDRCGMLRDPFGIDRAIDEPAT
jgi:uncharacterized glyoxalase superfamily protein PhnB